MSVKKIHPVPNDFEGQAKWLAERIETAGKMMVNNLKSIKRLPRVKTKAIRFRRYDAERKRNAQ